MLNVEAAERRGAERDRAVLKETAIWPRNHSFCRFEHRERVLHHEHSAMGLDQRETA